MASDYEPDAELAALFARFKRTHQAHRDLLKLVKKVAPDEMRKGATVGDLARLTGLTDEVFRRIGRKNEIELLRPPTFRREQASES